MEFLGAKQAISRKYNGYQKRGGGGGGWKGFTSNNNAKRETVHAEAHSSNIDVCSAHDINCVYVREKEEERLKKMDDMRNISLQNLSIFLPR